MAEHYPAPLDMTCHQIRSLSRSAAHSPHTIPSPAQGWALLGGAGWCRAQQGRAVTSLSLSAYRENRSAVMRRPALPMYTYVGCASSPPPAPFLSARFSNMGMRHNMWFAWAGKYVQTCGYTCACCDARSQVCISVNTRSRDLLGTLDRN